jgi:hypothetical protein
MANLKLAYDTSAISIAPLLRGAGLKFKGNYSPVGRAERAIIRH